MPAKAGAAAEVPHAAVGTVEQIMALRGESTEVTELSGRALIPGFVDAHGHVIGGGIQALAANMLPAPDGPVNDIPAMQQTLRDWMAANADAMKQVNLIVG